MKAKTRRTLIDISIAMGVVVILTLLSTGYFGTVALLMLPLFALFVMTHKA